MAAEAVGERPRTGGWRVVARKETADHLRSIRFVVLLCLVGLASAGSVYAASGVIRDVAEEVSGAEGLFLELFTASPERIPSFLTLVAFLVPLLGIAFGFDAVNSERAQGTLARLVAQPIRRDDVINGKFLGALAVIGSALVALTLVVSGLGILRLGLVPAAEEVARVVVWLALTLAYAGLWLAFATMVSVVLRRASTSALVAIAAWLVLTLFADLLAGLTADALAPAGDDAPPAEQVRNEQIRLWAGRLSPAILYEEATSAVLNPRARTVGFLLTSQVDRAVPDPLPLSQSLAVAWPQSVAVIALAIVCFAAAYVLFMRQEIRA
jgi:ABC-2 type transport system permease protein